MICFGPHWFARKPVKIPKSLGFLTRWCAWHPLLILLRCLGQGSSSSPLFELKRDEAAPLHPYRKKKKKKRFERSAGTLQMTILLWFRVDWYLPRHPLPPNRSLHCRSVAQLRNCKRTTCFEKFETLTEYVSIFCSVHVIVENMTLYLTRLSNMYWDIQSLFQNIIFQHWN